MQWFDAARKGDVKALQRHLKSGQDVNAKGATGASALIFAATNGRTAAVKLLLKQGADANVHAKGSPALPSPPSP
jgi:ankyrin repeat protein